MISAGVSLVLTALATQAAAADSLRELALRLPESAVILEARARPIAVREALSEALVRAVKGSSEVAREEQLAAARRLAAAYAVAWSDSFLVREVARFSAWPPQRRAVKVWADSVRRAGVAAFGRDGPTAAIAVWRHALSRALAIADTAGAGAVLGNIGAAFLEESQLDSAEAYLERAGGLAAAIGDIRVEANALGALAGTSQDRGNLAAAREQYARALALRERIGDTRGAAADHNNLGLLAQAVGDPDEARRQYESALALNRRDGRTEVAATNLVNLAGLAAIAGDFARAESLYRDALAIWRASEMWADAADALHGLGQLEVRRGDYPAARATLREALVIYDRTGPLTDALAVRRELAAVLGAAGELQGALDEMRRAERLADSARAPPGVRAGLALARADLAVQLNALAQAERWYREAGQLYRQAGNPTGEAEARQGQGHLFLAREDYVAAEASLEAALRAQHAAGNERAAALVRLSLGELSRERGDTGAAREQLARATTNLERLGDPVATAAALGERAALEAWAGSPVAAESLYLAALARLKGRVAPEVAWRLRAGLGLALRNRRAADASARELRAAVAEIELASRSLAVAERRSGFLADKWDVYAQLALTERQRGLTGAAFEASERLRAREMLELLARARVAAPIDVPAELINKEQDLRRRIAELTRDLEDEAAADHALRGPDVPPVSGATGEALVRAQEAYAELRLEMRERAPRHAALVWDETASWRDVARRMAPDEAFVEYLVSDSGSLAFVVVRDTMVAVELGVRRRDLARLVELARGTLEPRGSSLADSLWRGPLRRLHRHLIVPVEETGLLAKRKRLVLVPHAELHYLPFAALLDGDERGRFLIQRYELTVTPSASVWLTLAELPTRRATAGVLAFAPKPDALPASRREVAAISRLAGTKVRVLSGSAASEEAFRREAPARSVLHLATYGVLNKHNPLFSFVELAPGGAHDGRLEVHEVFALSLAADLVVLSACQSGLGSGAFADVPAGDDWIGLTRAFLHAGAATVVATLWPVDDWATAVLIERFYEAYAAGADAARALAAAQGKLRGAPATAHPFYWAGFVVVGTSDVHDTPH